MILFEFDIDYYVIYPFVIHLLAYWISSTFFIYLDKIYSTYATIGYEKYIRAIKNSLSNQFLITLPILYLLHSNIKYAVIKSENDNLLMSFIKLFIIGNISNLIFYCIHRLLHTKLFYKYIHYKHHEYIIPIAPAALYSHPLEHIICNNLAFMIPYILIGLRYDFLLLSIILGSINTTFSHTKYIESINMNHYIHHKKFNYNYGFGTTLDKIFRTQYKIK